MICVARGATAFGTGNCGRRSTVRRYGLLRRIAPSSGGCSARGGACNSTPRDIVVNDFMVVHPDVDGDMVTRVFVESAERWERMADVGFRAGAPDEFDALHFMRKRRGGDGVHVAVVVVNRDTGAGVRGDIHPGAVERRSPGRADNGWAQEEY